MTTTSEATPQLPSKDDIEPANHWWKLIVDRRWLFFVAGFMWSTVGVMLIHLAMGWLESVEGPCVWGYGTFGVLAALVIYRFGFSRLVRKNIARINLMAQKASLFAFQKKASYVLIVVMILLGKMLRSTPLPKPYLAILYMGIGGGLFLASLHCYWQLTRTQSVQDATE